MHVAVRVDSAPPSLCLGTHEPCCSSTLTARTFVHQVNVVSFVLSDEMKKVTFRVYLLDKQRIITIVVFFRCRGGDERSMGSA